MQSMTGPFMVDEALDLIPKGKACTQAGFREFPAVAGSGGDSQDLEAAAWLGAA
jgi:hypothetical protein